MKEKQDVGSRKGKLTFVLEADMGLNLSSASNCELGQSDLTAAPSSEMEVMTPAL